VTTRTELKPIADVLGDQEYGLYSSYGSLIDSFGYENILQVDDDDYQGDSRVLFQDLERIGYLQFGWGSCSGCDALQGCDTADEIDDLRYGLYDSIHWFRDKDDALAWFESHDWEGDYSFHSSEQLQFVNQAKALLGGGAEEKE
jgi:hypothetical protein